MGEVPLSQVSMGDEEIEAISRVVQSGWVSKGRDNKLFEEEFSKLIGAPYGIAVSNCFAALYAVLKCSGISGEVIVPSFTFVASVNAIELAGATPVFADVDYATRNITIDHIRRKLTPRTEAILPVHFAGQPCQMADIASFAKEKGLLLIEDSAQTLGAAYQGQQAGAFGIGCYSFYATKNISTGEGGFITLKDADLATKLRRFISHGNGPGCGQPWNRNAEMAGMNFRMSQIQAAIGRVQLRKLGELNKKRQRIAGHYDAALSSLKSVECPVTAKGCSHVYQMYTVTVAEEKRDWIVSKLNEAEVMASVHFDPPVHQQSYYANRYDDTGLENTNRLSREIISLPIYPNMSNLQIRKVFETFCQLVGS